MSASTNMLEPPTAKTLTFAPTSEQWIYNDGDRKPSAEDTQNLSTITTKDADGPNEYTIFVGRVVAGYLTNQFRDTEGLRSVFGIEHVNTLGPYLVQDVQLIVDQLQATGRMALYYNAYKLHSGHLARIAILVNILHILNLENKLNGIVENAVVIQEASDSSEETSTDSDSDGSDGKCVYDDLELRFTDLLDM